MPPDLRRLEEALSETLAVPLRITASAGPLEVRTLSAGERSRHERLASPRRRQTWLMGRAALKRLLRRMGEEEDTAGLTFPHPRYSLTHSGSYAVAVGALPGSLRGIGVDLELSGTPRLEAARFFLTADEREWVAGLAGATQGGALRRLWTVKEALFKSDPDNGGRMLTHYRTESPAVGSGTAFAGTDGQAMNYASQSFAEGVLSVAVLVGQEVTGCRQS